MVARVRLIICLFLLTGWCVADTAAQPTVPQWVAFGDSITVGLGASQPTSSYIRRLEYNLGPIQNRAVGGTTIAGQLPAILAYADTPRHVLWLTGYNDMRAGTDPAAYQRDLDQGLRVLTERGMTVYLGLCLSMSADGYQAYGPLWNHGSDARVAELNERIRETAAAYPSVHVIAMSGYDPASDVSPDLVHPDDSGHAQIAEAFLRGIVSRVWLPFSPGSLLIAGPFQVSQRAGRSGSWPLSAPELLHPA